jgi:cytochrome c5
VFNPSMKRLLPTALVWALACSSTPEEEPLDSDDTNPSDNSSEVDTSSDTADTTTNETSETQADTGVGASCPSADRPTYDNFGEAFMQAYCTRCHSSGVSGIARNGATPNYDFDTLHGVVARIAMIEAFAAAGPNGTNTLMPPSDGPSLEERERLGQWLACLEEGAETPD